MVELFASERVDAFIARSKRLVLVLIAVAAVAVAACVPFVVFAEVNPVAMKVCVCIISVTAGWVCIALWGAYIAPYRRRSAFESTVLSAAKITVRGAVKTLQRTETVSQGVNCIVLEITAEDKNYFAYWDSFFGEPPFEIGKEYNICLADNIVCSYGEVEL